MSMPQDTMHASAGAAATSGLTSLATFTRYDDARHAVDAMSDAGMDVGQAAIVWHGLRRVERVTGRRTVLTAAVQGAIAGAWFGSFLGLLLGLFTDVDDWDLLAAVLTYLVVGAVLGAIWMGVAHWSTRGRRDFASFDLLDAERFEVLVAPEMQGAARDLLGVRTTRPMDPPPAAGPT
jgi:hypothetical protein